MTKNVLLSPFNYFSYISFDIYLHGFALWFAFTVTVRTYFSIYGKGLTCLKKWHPTLVTPVDLFFQNWLKLKVLMTFGLNRLSSCTHIWYVVLFLVPFFLLRILRINDNDGKIIVEVFTFFIFKKHSEMPPPNSKMHKKNF